MHRRPGGLQAELHWRCFARGWLGWRCTASPTPRHAAALGTLALSPASHRSHHNIRAVPAPAQQSCGNSGLRSGAPTNRSSTQEGRGLYGGRKRAGGARAGAPGGAARRGQVQPGVWADVQGPGLRGRQEGAAQADPVHHRCVAPPRPPPGPLRWRHPCAWRLSDSCAERVLTQRSRAAERGSAGAGPGQRPGAESVRGARAGEDLLVASADKPFRFPVRAWRPNPKPNYRPPCSFGSRACFARSPACSAVLRPPLARPPADGARSASCRQWPAAAKRARGAQATFTFVVRSFTVLDGIGKTLDPRFDISEIAAPYARELLLEGSPQIAKLRSELGKRLAVQARARLGALDARRAAAASPGTSPRDQWAALGPTLSAAVPLRL